MDIAAITKTDVLDGAYSTPAAPAATAPATPAGAARADSLTILPGVISMIYVAEGMTSVLQGMKDKAAGTHYAAMLEAMTGTSACVQMASMTSKDAREDFGCFIGDDLVIGHFDIVTFAEGDRVKIIGSRLYPQAYIAHAVVRMSDGRLWLSSGTDKGRLKVALRDAVTCAMLLTVAAAMLGICHLIAPWSEGYPALLAAFAPAFIGLGILCLGYMVYSASGNVLFTERIFRLLGFKKPWMVNLAPFSEARIGPGGSRGIYHLWDAFKAYGVLKAIPARR